MLRTMLKSKIHRATVTQADLHYVGSVTIDADLMDAADLIEGEQVTIVDIDNGARLVTYAITGERGSGVIGINGAAAHLVHPGDLVILIAYAHDGGCRGQRSTGRGWCSSTRTTEQVDLGHRPRPRAGRCGRTCCRRGEVRAARDRRPQHPHRRRTGLRDRATTPRWCSTGGFAPNPR